MRPWTNFRVCSQLFLFVRFFLFYLLGDFGGLPPSSRRSAHAERDISKMKEYLRY